MSSATEEDPRSVHHRLLSIVQDSTLFLKNVICAFRLQHSAGLPNYNLVENEMLGSIKFDKNICQQWPVVANERCGSWYAYPFISEYQQGNNHGGSTSSTHFKSTDGHIHIYNFSLRRLNFDFLHTVMNASQNNGAVLLVDASKYKIQPDSFSATLPIWCAVLNQLVPIYKKQVNGVDGDGIHDSKWCDDSLFTPLCISPAENKKMKSVIPDRVQAVIESKVILNPKAFLDKMKKPLRCFWIENSGDYECNLKQVYSDVRKAQRHYMCIVCISCSDPERNRKENAYISGAGDDEESWANGLTPTLLWEYRDEILSKNNNEDIQKVIESLVKKAKSGNEEWFRSRTGEMLTSVAHANVSGKVRPCFTSYFDTIGSTRISIGTRRSGRPPDCWDHFDAVVNVTTMEYPEMSSGTIPDGKFYLQLPVKEGKRDRSELENWMAIAMLFIGVHAASHQRQVLIHCAQGMDRSVAIAMAAICIYFPQVFTTKNPSNLEGSKGDVSTSNIFEEWTGNVDYALFEKFIEHDHEMSMDSPSNHKMYKSSGIPQHFLASCMGREGRDLFFSFIDHLQKQNKGSKMDRVQYDDNAKVFATKETLRLALVYIHQFRPKACPTRSTMQKLNRFFMSGLHEPA